MAQERGMHSLSFFSDLKLIVVSNERPATAKDMYLNKKKTGCCTLLWPKAVGNISGYIIVCAHLINRQTQKGNMAENVKCESQQWTVRRPAYDEQDT